MPETHAFAAILSAGDELTLGQTLDTNSRWLAERLTSMGIVPLEHATVPDDKEAHAAALLRLADRVDVIICTGGLGPTSDDLARQALGAAMGEDLVEDEIALAQIETWYGARGRPMPALNRVQALRPRGAITIPNLNGTAPGLLGEVRPKSNPGKTCDIFVLPGPPAEMVPMFETQVAPRLVPPPGRVVRTRVLHCLGIGESDLATRLGPLMERSRVPLVGTTASGGMVSVRMRCEGAMTREAAEEAMAAVERDVRARGAPFVFGADEDTLAGVIVHALRGRDQTLAVVESCTGGLLGAMITEVAGSSHVFSGGWITYSNEMKTAEVGVPAAHFENGGPGAVSPETAAAMAVGGLKRAGADWCLAITGIAGPEGGGPHKPVGTVYIALASRGALGEVVTDTRLFRMGGDRRAVRDWSAKSALGVLWMHLTGNGGERLMRQA